MLPNEVTGYGLLEWSFTWEIKRAGDKADPSDRKPRIQNILTMKLLHSLFICFSPCKVVVDFRVLLHFSMIFICDSYEHICFILGFVQSLVY